MLPTGYNILNGGVAADLSTIFEPLPEGGTMYATPTGFIQYSTGKDLRELFAVNTSYTIPYNTNWIAQNGQDLRYIFQGGEPPVVTIGGTGAYTENIAGNKYTYTFTGGTKTISINKNITSFYVIVVGGGGTGGRGNTNGRGGGGGGAGFGYVTFSYVSGTTYNVSVAAATTAQDTNGRNSSFLNLSGQGVTATGGAKGLQLNSPTRAGSGTFSNNGPGTFEPCTGGDGGNNSNRTGGNSSGSFTVLGVSYNFGGGGQAGAGVGSTTSNRGGNAGANGVGGSGIWAVDEGANATTPGSGGGGGAWNAFNPLGGTGGPGLVIVIFTYP